MAGAAGALEFRHVNSAAITIFPKTAGRREMSDTARLDAPGAAATDAALDRAYEGQGHWTR